MLMLAACAVSAAFGCTDLLTPNARTDLRADAGSPRSVVAQVLRGCTRLEVAMRGRDDVSVRAAIPTANDGCGPVHIVIAGRAEFDRARGTLRLPIAIVNGGSVPLRTPARVIAWDDSLTVLEPAGLRAPSPAAYVSLVAADSVLPLTAADFPGAATWSLDSLLASTSDALQLAPGDTSGVRWIGLRVHAGIQRLTLPMWAEAATAPTRTPVPDHPPETTDSAWARVTAPENVLDARHGLQAKWVWNAFYVAFQDTVTRDTKQAILDSISAHVVGGMSMGSRRYYLVTVDLPVPADAEVGLDRLFAIIDRLETNPAVHQAIGIELSEPESFYRSPTDAGDFAQYELRPDLASGANWGLEAIRSPLAWGCERGSEAIRIAVLDRDFRRLSEIDYAGASVKDFGGTVDPNFAGHGSAVASVLGAKGNNGVGMSGVLWRTPLELYDIDKAAGPGVNPDKRLRPFYRMEAAFRSGAKVVNASLGLLSFPDNYTPSHGKPADVRKVTEVHKVLRDVFAPYMATRADPLLVVAAGNRPLALYWTGWSLVADTTEFKLSTLFVAAAGWNNGGPVLWARSGRDTLVTIAAPGVDVGVLDQNGRIARVSGTSVAAPHVSGVAGLIRSFDPTLTADSTRTLILAGARAGARTVQGDKVIPFLDAYEALRATAKGSGTRLCGNPVWHDGTAVYARRAHTSEKLFDAPPGEPEYLNVYHGGRQIDIEFDYRFVRSESGAWSQTAIDVGPDSVPAGSLYSSMGLSHDADRLASVRTNGVEMTVEVHDRVGTLIAQLKRPVSATGSGSTVCIFRLPNYDDDGNLSGYRCALTTQMGSSTSELWPSIAISPAGDFVLAAVPIESRSSSVGGWGGCFDDEQSVLCLQGTDRSSVDRTIVYRAPIQGNGSWTEVANLPGVSPGWIAIGDDGSSFAMSTSTRTGGGSWRGSWRGLQVYGDPDVCSDSKIRFFELDASGSSSETYAGPMHDSTACSNRELSNGGFAPDRARAPRMAGN